MSTNAAEVPRRLYRQLAARIATLIRDGTFVAGSRLPPERDLAERFDVSRASVREAVIALELAGQVEVRSGSGIYVLTSRPAAEISDEIAGAGPFELLRARALLESEVCAAAADHAKDGDIDRIFAALQQLGGTLHQYEENDVADRRFHLAIAEATGNSALLQVISMFWNQHRGMMWIKATEHLHTSELRLASHDDHQRIFEAIVARDPRAARKAMRDHLERVAHAFARSWRRVSREEARSMDERNDSRSPRRT